MPEDIPANARDFVYQLDQFAINVKGAVPGREMDRAYLDSLKLNAAAKAFGLPEILEIVNEDRSTADHVWKTDRAILRRPDGTFDAVPLRTFEQSRNPLFKMEQWAKSEGWTVKSKPQRREWLDGSMRFQIEAPERAKILTWLESWRHHAIWHTAGNGGGGAGKPNGKREWTVSEVRDMTGMSDTTFRDAAKKAKVPTAKQGGKDHRFTSEQAIKILSTIIDNSPNKKWVENCRSALQKHFNTAK